MKKKISSILIILIVVFQSCITAFASGDTNVSFEGDAKKFVFLNGSDDLFGNFKDMMPGESRTQKITLTNNGYDQMRFYMSARVQDELGDGGAVFNITLKKDGTEFYSGLIGGLQQFGEGYMKDNFLLESLGKGASTDIEMTLKIDGETMDNAYKNKEGTIEFTFSVEQDNQATEKPDPKPTEKPVNPGGTTPSSPSDSGGNSTTRQVKTGDNSPIFLYGGIMAFGALVFLISCKRKKAKEKGE